MPSDRAIVRSYLETAPPTSTVQELLDALDETEPPAPAPHRVHTAGGGRQDQDPVDRDVDGRKVAKRTGSTHVGLVDCPDCTRGLVSRGDRGMVCSRLELEEAMSACHPGCTVACGLEG